MRKCALAPYTIRIKERGKSTRHPLLSSFFEREDLFHVIKAYLSKRKGQPLVDQDLHRALIVERFETSHRSFSGVFRKGEFGTEEPLMKIRDFDIAHIKQKDEAHMFPYYFYAIIPQVSNEGLMVFEKIGHLGIKENFDRDFGTFFTKRYPKFLIEINPLLPKKVFEIYIDRGEISKIRFVRFKVPADLFDQLDITNFEEQVEAELVLKIKESVHKKIKNKIKKFIKAENPITEFVELPDFKFSDVKIDLALNGRTRAFSLQRPLSSGAVLDLTKDDGLVEGSNGHPTFESIDFVARQFANDIQIEMGNRD